MADRIKNLDKYNEISSLLDTFSREKFHLHGLTSAELKHVLILQIIDSIRRVEYLRLTSMRAKSASLFTPYSGSFEPFGGSAALLKKQRTDDAYWLVYLATHFGKHKIDGWNLLEDFYGRFRQGGSWTWSQASADPFAIANWLKEIYPNITQSGRTRRFGNHRKFETLKPGPKGTGYAVASYIQWIKQYGSHQNLILHAQRNVGQNPADVYAFLYKELDAVAKFGRLGKFDFLCNLSNLLIAPIIPDKAYIAGSTGPKDGAKLLLGDQFNNTDLELSCASLSEHLNVSPQVVEDALCNWQKSPNSYMFFRG